VTLLYFSIVVGTLPEPNKGIFMYQNKMMNIAVFMIVTALHGWILVA
jgi:hypothetical protein